jgi:UbiD family decarboxylase
MSETTFSDLRGWVQFLEQQRQLARIRSRVRWDEELGAVVRRTYDVYGEASPAMLFENIEDYQPPGPNKLFVGQFRSYSRIAMSMGLPPTGISIRDIVNRVRHCLKGPIPFVTAESGTAQQNVVPGDEANIFDFPIPLWHHRDGGRYLGTMHVVITKDYDSDWVNVGLYRIMALEPNEATIYVSPGRQHIGQQYFKYVEAGEPMPIAVAIGLEPTLPLVGSMLVPSGQCEYDYAGALKGSPVETLRGRTVDLPVPANAEIVIEGYIDPAERKTEGPFGEYPGYYGEVPSPKPVIHVTAITHRDDPIFQGSMEGHPIAESHVMAAIIKSATAWDVLERNGIMGVKDVACIPEASTGHLVVAIKPSVQGHADWIASALWGTSTSVWNFKHIIVVDEDIDPWDSGQVNWSLAWRVKASEDIKIWKDHRGSPIDPRQEPERKGYWDRVLIDATRPYDWEPRAIWGSDGVNKGTPQKFPPTTRPRQEVVELVNNRWGDYGIEPVRDYIGTPVGMMRHWWDPRNS